MKLVLHIVRKDLRRMRWWLLAWVGVLALPILLGASMLADTPSFDGQWNRPDMVNWLLSLEAFVAYLLTLLLLEEDALVGSQQFWRMRPITGGQLLAAKAIGIAVLLGLVPVVVSLPWWLWCGFGVREIVLAAFESCAVATLIAVPAALVAVLTDSLARALLWTVVLVGVVAAGILFFAIICTITVGDGNDKALWISRAIVAVSLVALVLAVVVGAQFFVRRRGWWLAASAALVMISLFYASGSPARFFGGETPPEMNASRVGNIGVRFDRLWMEPMAPREVRLKQEVPHQEFEATFLADPPAAHTILMGLVARQTLRWADGVTIERFDQLHNHSSRLLERALHLTEVEVELATATPTIRSQTAGPPPPPSWPAPQHEVTWRDSATEVSLGAWAKVPSSFAARMMNEPPRYSARLWLATLRPEIAVELPLQPGGWHGAGSRRNKVTRVTRSDDDTMVAFVSGTRPFSILAALDQMARRVRGIAGSDEMEGMVVVNRKRGEFMVDGSGDSWSIMVNGVNLNWSALGVAGHAIRSGKHLLPPGWLDDAALGVLVFHPEAVFTRDVEVGRLDVKQ